MEIKSCEEYLELVRNLKLSIPQVEEAIDQLQNQFDYLKEEHDKANASFYVLETYEERKACVERMDEITDMHENILHLMRALRRYKIEKTFGSTGLLSELLIEYFGLRN